MGTFWARATRIRAVPSPVIIPLGTERRPARAPTATVVLIAVNVAVFTAMIATAQASGAASLDEGSDGVLTRFAWDSAKPGEWWRYLTYAFLHSPTDWFHILGNMVFLWVFGPSVEGRLGRTGFSVLYLVGAAASAWAHSMATGAGLIGASGAVSTVAGAFLVLYPRVPFRILLFPFFGIYVIPAYWFIVFNVAFDFIGLKSSTNVSHSAHLGGYVVGIVASTLLLATGVLKREPQYDLVSIFKHKKRLTEFRAATAINREREEKVLRKGKAEQLSPESESIAIARAEVSTNLSKHDLVAAAAAYKDMLARFPKGGTAVILSKQNQLAVGNALFQQGDAAMALPAYRHFLVQYAKDPQAAHVRLMIGLIRTRYVPEFEEAKREIEAALPGLTEDEDKAMAKELLEEIGRSAKAMDGPV